jgi:trigger factor
MIRRQYDKQILEGLREHLLAKGYQQAMKEHGFEPVAEMNLEESELKAGRPFSYSVTLDVAPQFDLPAYKGLEVDTRKVEIADEAVTEAVDRYLEGTGKYEDVTEPRPVQANDMVAVDYDATVDGRPMAEVSGKAKDLASGRDFWVIASEEYSFCRGSDRSWRPEAGESKEISVAFDEQSPIEELRGRTGVFHATVKKIRARKKPALDEALFQSLGVKDEAELRETFRGFWRARRIHRSAPAAATRCWTP